MAEVYIEGYISRKAIERILKNWHEVGADKKDYSEVGSDNPVRSDGVSGGQINKIMIDQALKKIPNKKVQYSAYARWIYNIPASRTLARLGISRHTYDKYCNQAVDFIYSEINGERAGVKNLIELILQGE
ncbi:hypothetical protein [Metabacillus fastidiosus]|uniref:hypothetical protein n=1 Tax=Metabacillus fastidiosus TaxID=1458 RepID=UPI003D286070